MLTEFAKLQEGHPSKVSSCFNEQGTVKTDPKSLTEGKVISLMENPLTSLSRLGMTHESVLTEFSKLREHCALKRNSISVDRGLLSTLTMIKTQELRDEIESLL